MSAQGWSVATTLGNKCGELETLKVFALKRTLSGLVEYFPRGPRVLANARTLG
jgi:hypothetical protein